jgi:hypothetical protein
MKRLCLMLILALAASTAVAQDAKLEKLDKMEARLQARFERADRNHDGKLTYAEAQGGMPFVARHFGEIDKGRKGYVTMLDIETFIIKKIIEARKG